MGDNDLWAIITLLYYSDMKLRTMVAYGNRAEYSWGWKWMIMNYDYYFILSYGAR